MAKITAKKLARMPHEFLVAIMEGEEQFNDRVFSPVAKKFLLVRRYPTLAERIDAAKAAAPYYAPKLGMQLTDPTGLSDIQNLSQEALQERIKRLTDAAQQSLH